MFHPPDRDDTKLRQDETVFHLSRRHPETGAGYQPKHQTKGHKGPV